MADFLSNIRCFHLEKEPIKLRLGGDVGPGMTGRSIRGVFLMGAGEELRSRNGTDFRCTHRRHRMVGRWLTIGAVFHQCYHVGTVGSLLLVSNFFHANDATKLGGINCYTLVCTCLKNRGIYDLNPKVGFDRFGNEAH